MRILICDDEDLAIKILRRYLTQWGHEVTSAEDGAQAWELFQKGEFPIVISDWSMPHLDGLELIRRIRAAERAYVYTILITGRTSKEDLVRGMEAGADDFVSKPFDRDELRVRLREGERIITLERALAEAESTREQRLCEQVKAAVADAEKELAAARDSLGALGAGAGDALARLERIQNALDALRKVAVARVTPPPV